MSSGPDHRLPAEPTFADVMNGFSFDASRSPRRRRWGRRRDAEPEPEQYTPTPAAAPVDPYSQPYGILPPTGPIDGGRMSAAIRSSDGWASSRASP